MADNNKKYITKSEASELWGGDNFSAVTLTAAQTIFNSSIDTTYLVQTSNFNPTYTFRLPATIPSDGKMHTVSIISTYSTSSPNTNLKLTLNGSGRSVYYTNLITSASNAQLRIWTLFTSSDLPSWYGFYYAVG